MSTSREVHIAHPLFSRVSLSHRVSTPLPHSINPCKSTCLSVKISFFDLANSSVVALNHIPLKDTNINDEIVKKSLTLVKVSL